MVKRFIAQGRGLFVRNPHYRVWSPDRPDGFPDQIETRSTDEPDAMAAAVDRGRADIAILDFGVGLTTSLTTRSGARRAGARSSRLFTVRGGKVRSVAVAAPRTIARATLLRRYLRAAA